MHRTLAALLLSFAPALSGCGCGGLIGGDGTDAGLPPPSSDSGDVASDSALPEPIPPAPGDIFPADGPGEGANGGPYPLVLCHGMGGFEAIGPLNYYFGVADHLTSLGHVVFTTQVPMFASVAERATLLAPQIDQILADTGAAKVNLIGHSQGGLDVRYLVSTLGYGPVVASITTIASPHRGTEVADVIAGVAPEPATDLLGAIVGLFGQVIGQNGEQDVMASMVDMTTDNMVNVFNPMNPDDPGVTYFSVTGVCQLPPYLIGVEDLCDLEIQPTWLYLSDVAGDNDGLVSVASAEWGTFLGTIPADHLDEVGQIGGITSFAFPYLDFYEDLADFLVSQGF